jgi:hypothetical protein
MCPFQFPELYITTTGIVTGTIASDDIFIIPLKVDNPTEFKEALTYMVVVEIAPATGEIITVLLKPELGDKEISILDGTVITILAGK